MLYHLKTAINNVRKQLMNFLNKNDRMINEKYIQLKEIYD